MGGKWRLWVMPWTCSSFAWGEIPKQTAICWQMQQNGENIHRLLSPERFFQQHTVSKQTGWRCSSGRGVKRWQPTRSSEPSARPNEARQHSPSSVGCSWWRQKTVRCMNHISSLAIQAFEFDFTNKSIKNPLRIHILLALSSRPFLSNNLWLHRVDAVQYLSLSSSALSLTTSYVSRIQMGFKKEEHLVSSFGSTEGRVAWLEGKAIDTIAQSFFEV